MHKNTHISPKILTDILTYFNIYNIISLINLNKPEQIIKHNKTHNNYIIQPLNNKIIQLLHNTIINRGDINVLLH